MALQTIPSPIFAGSRTIWRIDGQDFGFQTAKQEPHRWVWRPEPVETVVHFINRNIRHVRGRLRGELIELMPWLMACTCELFGWVDKETGHRRYFEFYGEVGRKNSKTLWNAGLIDACLTVLFPKGGAEVFMLASTELQAKNAFNMANEQIELSEKFNGKLHKYLVGKESLLRIENITNDSFAQVLTSSPEGKTGSNPAFVLADEMHEINNRKLLTSMRTGSVAQDESLFSMISTAGDNVKSVGYSEHVYANKVIEGLVDNDRYCAIIFAASDKDDPHSVETWKKANPGLGISVKVDQLKAIHDKAWAMHTGSAGDLTQEEDDVSWDEFLRYHLNIWTTKSSGYIAAKAWQDCYDEDVLNKYGREGMLAFGGLDLAESIDMNSFALLFPEYKTVEYENKETGEVEAMIRIMLSVLPWYWVCEAAAEASERTTFKYRRYSKHNLEIMPGVTTDQDLIEQRIKSIIRKIPNYTENFKELGYDPYNALGIASRLSKPGLQWEGITCTKVRQGILTLNEPTKFIQVAALRGDLKQPGNKVLDWNVQNAQVIYDKVRNMMISKLHSTGKIDGLAAVITGTRCVLDAGTPDPDTSSHFKDGWTL